MYKEIIQQFRSPLMNPGRGFTSSSISSSAATEEDYGRLIRQKQEEIIELVHAYNNNKKGKASSGSGKDTSKIKLSAPKFRELLFQ
jgi:hypothetical protein